MGRIARLPRRRRRRSRRSSGRVSRSCASRRRVSWKNELPPSIRMSPASSSGVSCSIISSTGSPAGIIIMIRRGRSSAATSSSSVFVPGELRLRVIADERVGPVRLQVPDDDGKPVLLDVEREVAPHGAQADDRKRSDSLMYLPRGHERLFERQSRVRTPSSSAISAASDPSPSGTMRADPSTPSTAPRGTCSPRSLPCAIQLRSLERHFDSGDGPRSCMLA